MPRFGREQDVVAAVVLHEAEPRVVEHVVVPLVEVPGGTADRRLELDDLEGLHVGRTEKVTLLAFHEERLP